MPSVTIYSRENCHLCEEAIETIETVAAELSVSVDLDVVDVDDDPQLRAEYGERVPYVFVDDTPKFKFRVDPDDLRAVLGDHDYSE